MKSVKCTSTVFVAYLEVVDAGVYLFSGRDQEPTSQLAAGPLSACLMDTFQAFRIMRYK